MSKITLADVAAESSVHAGTVSRAISQPHRVHPETLARINAAIDRLGYVPDRAARQLARGRTAALALLVPDITNPFFSTIVSAAQRRATAADLVVLFANTAQDPDTELDAVRSLAPNVDGVIVCSPVAAWAQIRSAARDRPVVFVNRRARSVSSVVVDQGQVIAIALEHLRSLGHRSVAVVRGPTDYWSSTQRERHARRHGDVTLAGPAAPTFEGGRSLLPSLLDDGVTAVAAFNDIMALGLLAEASARGVLVPGEVSVVGSDGVPLAGMVTPSLTTVAAPLEDLATTAVDLLLDLLGGGSARQGSLSPHLVVGQSTGRAP